MALLILTPVAQAVMKLWSLSAADMKCVLDAIKLEEPSS